MDLRAEVHLIYKVEVSDLLGDEQVTKQRVGVSAHGVEVVVLLESGLYLLAELFA